MGEHTSRPACAVFIGVGRFKIFGGGRGARFRILGGGGGEFSAGTLRRTDVDANDVASTSFRRHVPTRFLINQCQIMTFFILKSDNIENSREFERNSFASTFKSKFSYILLLIYPSLVTFVIFSCFT